MNKKIFLLVLIAVLVLPLAASADIAGIVSTIILNAMLIGGAIVVIGWILTGYLFLTAGGEASKLNNAKTALITMIAGTIVMYIISLGGSNALNFVKQSFGL